MSHTSFVPFCTFIDTTFWAELNRRKLHEWRLDETPREISGQFSLFDTTGYECRLSLSHDSFERHSPGAYHGRLILLNTLENFKGVDRKALLFEEACKVWENIESGEWLLYPERLVPFVLTVYADLKKFHYYYWNCFPALCFPENVKEKVRSSMGAPHQRYNHPPRKLLIVFADPSPVVDCAGWPLRNLVAAVAYMKRSWRWCSFISLRGGNIMKDVWPTANCYQLPTSVGWERNIQGKMVPQFADMRKILMMVPNARFHVLFLFFRLMEQSVGLNLSLMKWRLVPEMKLERYTTLKVLIFGAGTLGSNIARCLMAWGVKKITFVDNSFVSYSNPVRQTLSEFEDAREARGKAETAARALQRIYPSIEAEGIFLRVPMPGHTIDESDLEAIEKLVITHDVVFLALDSREARWLPTVLATKHGKMAFSVALGFDNYVVIRHGVKTALEKVMPSPSGALIPYSELACYFCSDVTAPGNSAVDRTLDQQCTVSRAGLSMIASGVAVELLASILQYPDPLLAPANIGEPDDSSSLLGATPHQVRGYLSRFSQMTPCVRRFEKCVACGNTVSEEYSSRGAVFVKEVMNCPSYLEKLTGLDRLQDSINDVHIEFSDNDSVMSL
ncbi:unnamed protein product [Haemonchus placei]|uniref:Ubiquitin-like modifier-activating enzyme ATG7 n=1 Tax=Haemonchus placei TaxID=6290 RepID=A0A158QJQ0_HAEPC|nr:unnamed protein product [Haemonchus placei]